jgi:hypothetical protein
MSEYGTYDELVDQLRKLQSEYAGTLARHGRFCSGVVYAAFGHTNALTHEQIVASLRTLREDARGIPRARRSSERTGQARFSRAGKEAMTTETTPLGAGESSPAPDGSRCISCGKTLPDGVKTACDRCLHIYVLLRAIDEMDAEVEERRNRDPANAPAESALPGERKS